MTQRDDGDEPEIVEDEPCGRCGYNLRGLREGHRCPECGAPIPRSFPLDSGEDPLEPFRRIADTIERELDAVLFVWNAIGFAGNRAIRAGRRSRRFSAEEFGWCLRDFAVQEFEYPAAARERLAAWGIGRSEDVGAIVFAFVDAGLLKAEETDRPSDFAGVFDLDTLFAE
jgi:uncharacterized repeat protein (TIGR04138 family)